MRWRIFYTDRSSFSSEDGSPSMAPGCGVWAIAQEDPEVGCEIHRGSDYYVYDENLGGWKGMNDAGFWPWLAKPGFKVVKLGSYMDTATYRAMLEQLREAGLTKSARYPWED